MNKGSDRHSSCCTNGLEITSLPSTGLTNTRRVPLATTNPNDRVDSFPSSSTGRGQQGAGNERVADMAAYLLKLPAHHPEPNSSAHHNLSRRR